MRPCYLEIDLNAIADNVRAVRRHAGKQVMAVLKANAYGHGLVPAAEAVVKGGADCLGVALVEEAAQLRDAGIQAPLVVLGAPALEQAPEIVYCGAQCVVPDEETARALSQASRGQPVDVHVKVDTGMSRVGTPPQQAAALVSQVLALPGLRLAGVCSHLAAADEDPELTIRQITTFEQVLAGVRALSPPPFLAHLANSAGTLFQPQAPGDLVRVGLLVYGAPPPAPPFLATDSPAARFAQALAADLRPALAWKGALTQVRDFRAGARVSYGGTARLSRPSRLAILPVGYADGFALKLSGRGRVLVRGQWAPVVGRVCMDQCVLDVTDVAGASRGDDVVILGAQGGETQSATDLAAQALTVTHDILAGLSDRLPRRYPASHKY